jgi:sensor domain CHASE-containing protein
LALAGAAEAGAEEGQMTLRIRTLVSVGLSLVCLIAIFYLVARVSMLRSFAVLEQQDTRQDLEQASRVLADDLSSLDHTITDYAAWDQTCAFIAGRSPHYSKTEFPDETFPRLHIDFV